MRLSTRLTMAMIAHAFITVAVLAALNYRVLEATDVSSAQERFQRYPRGLAAELEATTAWLKAAVLELRGAPEIGETVRASRGDVVSPDRLDDHRAGVAAQCARMMAASPTLLQCRLLGIAGGGRTIVRVDRAADGSDVRVVSDAEAAQASVDDADQELIRRAFEVGAGEIFASTVQVDRDHAAGAPRAARLSVAAPVRSPDDTPFGVVVVTIDLGPALAKIAAAGTLPRPVLLAPLPRRLMFVIDEHGHYLVSPDSAGNLGLAASPSARLQDDFPGLTEANWRIDQIGPIMMKDRRGAQFAVGLTNARLAGDRSVVIVQLVAFTAVASSARNVAIAASIGALLAVLAAIAIAVLLGRTMSRPIVQMTDAVAAF
ncbi:MAG: hypothetical protein ABSG76_04175, partial [Xanthobacteraceae bacterium]